MVSSFDFAMPNKLIADPESFLSGVLRYEGALAKAQAEFGLIPLKAAQSIHGTCKVDIFDVPRIVRDGERKRDVVKALVSSLRETVGIFNKEAEAFVHYGGDSKEAFQTALSLISKEAIQGITSEIDQTIANLQTLAITHASDPVLDRIQMLPTGVTSFGGICIRWAEPLKRSKVALQSLSKRTCRVYLGGVQAISVCGIEHTKTVRMQMAREMGLESIAEGDSSSDCDWKAMACELAILTTSLAEIAQDIVCMSQNEVSELNLSQLSSQESQYQTCVDIISLGQRVPLHLADLLSVSSSWHSDTTWTDVLRRNEILRAAQYSMAGIANVIAAVSANQERMLVNVESCLQARTKRFEGDTFSIEYASYSAALVKNSLHIVPNGSI